MRQNELGKQFRQGQRAGQTRQLNFYELFEVKKIQTETEKLLVLV